MRALWIVAGCIVLAACPAPSTSDPEVKGSCEIARYSLTGDRSHSWFSGNVSFDGSATLVLCLRDLHRITPEVHERLFSALGEIVLEHGFAMLGVCLAPEEPEIFTKPGVAEAYLADHRAMVARFDSIVGWNAVRTVNCRFGWAHYDDDGSPVSGVE